MSFFLIFLSLQCEVEELEKRWTEITSRLQRLQSELAAIKTGSASELSSFVDAGVRNLCFIPALYLLGKIDYCGAAGSTVDYQDTGSPAGFAGSSYFFPHDFTLWAQVKIGADGWPSGFSLKSAFDCFEAIALIYSLHQSISSTSVLQLQQRSLLERIRELNDEIQSISYALNNNNNNGKVPSTPQLPCCTEKTDIVGSGVKKNRV